LHDARPIYITEILEFNLKNEGYEVHSVYSAEEGLKEKLEEYDLILLDVMMEGMSGYKMAHKIREAKQAIPIIFLTAKDTENDMLTGFSVGADDYIAKPFSIKEIVARIHAVLKRAKAKSQKQEEVLEIENLTIDLNLKEVSLNGQKLALTKTEFELLVLLAQHPHKIFSREHLIQVLWSDTPFITERTVDVHIARLRKKMQTVASAIANKQGYGYYFNPGALCD